MRGDVRCSASRNSFKWFSNFEGDTLYIGSRSSGRLVRIYELSLLTGYKWRRCIIRWLQANGFVFRVAANGYPRVLEDHARNLLSGMVPRLRNTPNLAALKRSQGVAMGRRRKSRLDLPQRVYFNHTSSGFDSIWQRAMRKAIEAGDLKERFTEHDIRAKTATDDPLNAQQRLGHQSRAMTDR